MRTEQKVKILSWLVAGFALLTLSTLGTVFYLIHSEKIKQDAQLEADSVVMSGMYFRQALDLSPDQIDAFRELNQHFLGTAREINRSLDLARIQMYRELQKQDPDAFTCDKLADDIGRLHKELKMATCHFYLGMKDICNHEQNQKLHELFEPVFRGNTGFGHGRGGGRYRWGQYNSPTRSGN